MITPYRDGIPGIVLRGPLAWSTSTTISTRRAVLCWDVNRYYRDLGVPWPYIDATRGDLRRAFLAADGPNDPRLTYVFTQLLDGPQKAAYDVMPLGSVFEDRYVYEERRTRRMRELAGQCVDADDTALSEMLDNEGDVVEDGDHSAKESEPEGPYPFSVLLWKTERYDLAALERWQHLIIRAASIRKLVLLVSLGVMEDEPHDWMVGYQKGIPLVFVGRYVQPNQDEAHRIVQSLVGLTV